MSWLPGRQGGGYYKKLIALGRLWDAYILKYPPYSSIALHTDPVKEGKHWRLNLVLWGPQTFWTPAASPPWFQLGRLVIFRSDITPHAVSASWRTRYVLSIGWLRS